MTLYMLLPRSNHGRCRGVTPDGCVLYGDGTETPIASDAVDGGFRERVASVMRRIVSEEPVRKVPSVRECAWCDLNPKDADHSP